MRSNHTRMTMSWTVAAACVIAAAGCGDDDDASAAADAAESAYCDEARGWAVYEMDPVDDTDPEAFRAYWEDFVAYEEAALDTAPDEIKDDWELKIESEVAVNAILEKYDFDVVAMMESGTPEEEAAFDAPPEVQAAQDRILVYEGDVCGAQQPLPADVSYAGEEPGTYCELVMAENEQAAGALAVDDPAAVEAMFDAMAETAASLVDAAPAVIEDDVTDLTEWTAGRQRAAAERHGYDMRAAIIDGTPQDRADINSTDQEIREQFARVTAYEEQVCYG